MSCCRNFTNRLARITDGRVLPDIDDHEVEIQEVRYMNQNPSWIQTRLGKTSTPMSDALDVVENFISASDKRITDFHVRIDGALFLELRRDPNARRGFQILTRKVLV